MKRLLGSMVVVVLLGAPAFAQPPAPKGSAPAAAQDGFVPVDSPINPEDAMPAPRLVAIAYGFIWLVLFGYVASVKVRLAGVEREMEALSRRVAPGSK